MSTLRMLVECTVRTICAIPILGSAIALCLFAWQTPSYTSVETAILIAPILTYISVWRLWLPILHLPYWNASNNTPLAAPKGVVSKIYCQSTGTLLTSEAIPLQRSTDLSWPEDIFDRDELEELLRTSQDVLASHQK